MVIHDMGPMRSRGPPKGLEGRIADALGWSGLFQEFRRNEENGEDRAVSRIRGSIGIFIRDYKVWQFDHANADSIISGLQSGPLDDILIPLMEKVGAEPGQMDKVKKAVSAFLASKPKEQLEDELKEVYDTHLAILEKSPLIVYNQFIVAYCDILKACEQASMTAGIVHQLMPNLEQQGSLKGREIRQLIPFENGEVSDLDSAFLGKINMLGLKLDEAKAYLESIITKDAFRYHFHREIEAHTEKLGYTKAAVMMDILMRVHGTFDSAVYRDGENIVISAGCLLLDRYDNRHPVMWEGSLRIDDDKPQSGRQDLEIAIANAEKLKERFLKGEKKGEYSSRIGRLMNSINVPEEREKKHREAYEQDVETLERIKRDNSDLPMTYELKTSHAAHWAVAYTLKAQISLKPVLTHPNPSERIKSLVENLDGHIGIAAKYKGI